MTIISKPIKNVTERPRVNIAKHIKSVAIRTREIRRFLKSTANEKIRPFLRIWESLRSKVTAMV